DVGDPVSLTMIIKVGDEPTGEERLEAYGLEIFEQDGKIIVDGATFDSPAQVAGFDFDQEIVQVLLPANQPMKQLLYVPALLLLGFIYMLQRRRKPSIGASAEGAAA
ncbi:MAG: DUF3394 domain-containing protein, partial [Hyphomicrobiales bacterium]